MEESLPHGAGAHVEFTPFMWKLIGRIDGGLVVVLAATTLAAWPFWARPSLPTDTDAEIHVFRAAQVEQAIQNGVLYPRWAPDFYYGNGYPIFNYYAPLAYHLAAYFSLLSGLGVVAGTKFVLLLSAYLGAGGMYLFVRNRWGASEAMVGGVAWSFSPYILFLEPHARGEVAETLAIGISPVLFWSFDCVRRNGWGQHVPAAALTLAALVFSHPLTALVAYGFLLAFLLWDFLITPMFSKRISEKGPGNQLSAVAVAVALGLGMSALYWLPAGLEREAVRMDYYGQGHYDFRRHFIALGELVAPPILTDTGAAFPEFRFSLGTAQFALGMLGAVTVFHRRLRRSDTVLFTLGLFGAMYMTTAASQGVWEMIRPMRYFQFPMRFLGSAALALVPLCGMALAWTRLVRWRWVATAAPAVAIGALLWYALPLTYPPEWDDFGPTSNSRYHAEELQGKWLGTTCCHDFLPAAVEYVAPAEAVLTMQYLSEWSPVEKFDRSSLPAGVSVTLVESGPEHDVIRVDSVEGVSLKMFRFFFPGWSASIDGAELPIEVTKPDGRMLVHIPAGEHDVLIALRATPERRLAQLISLGSGIGWLLVVVLVIRHWQPEWGTVRGGLPPPALWLAVGVLTVVVGVKVVADNEGWFQIHSSGRAVATAEHQIFASVENEIELIGFNAVSGNVRPGQYMPVVLYWRAALEPTRNYQVYVHILDASGHLWGQSDKVNPASFPTTRWSTHKYVRDEHMVMVDTDAPAGEYQLFAGLWDHITGERFLAFDERNWLLGESIPLPVTITVVDR